MLVVLLVLAVPILITAVFTAEMIAGLRSLPRSGQSAKTGVPVTLIMPAHDEAAILSATLSRLLPEIGGWASLLVVADNCDDDTAAIARRHGVEVVVRDDRERRGKGYALDFARTHLRASPPAVVIIFDADCWSDRASLQALASAAVRASRPFQSAYLIEPKEGVPPMVQLSNFAFMVKNLVRQRGLQRLAGRVLLTGTGMSFPWPVFDQAPLASANIVEDIELGRALDSGGYPPQFLEKSVVWSDPSSAEGTLVQRTRWEGGFLAHARAHAPAVIGDAIRNARPRALIGGLDLCVPPLTLLAMIDIAALGLAALLTTLLRSPWWPLQIHALICCAALGTVGIAWFREGRRFMSFGTLLLIPVYILWKVPIYLGLVRRGPSEWLRAGR